MLVLRLGAGLGRIIFVRYDALSTPNFFRLLDEGLGEQALERYLAGSTAIAGVIAQCKSRFLVAMTRNSIPVSEYFLTNPRDLETE